MLRIHFTSQDLLRVRLASGPDPLWEAVLSAHQAHQPGGPPVFREWRSRVVPALTPEARAYLRITRPRDGLRPRAGTSTGTSAGTSTRPGAAAQAYHDEALAPFWPAIRCAVEADVAAHARTLTSGGTAALLSGLHRSVVWRDPVLSVATAVDGDLYLEGRGLTLQPVFFCGQAPFAPSDPELAPVLVYPVPHRSAWLRQPGAGRHDRALAALLGRTRAAALSALAHGASTSELARHIGVSAPSASEHASVLRDAGLIASRRERNSVWHTLTPLGRAVLDSGGVDQRVPAAVS
ncbi:ArsR/SmtB family transcription factor [Promicromonospora sukumoe]|uniref:ArsR/SmtB family transcription factor n=1 Tax=Promicromonospora sukumoe TaxID=88382 RepID=UPI0037CA0458